MYERTSLITRIFSDYDQVKMVGHLSGDDAQTFIDMIDEVSLCALLPPKLTLAQTSAPRRPVAR